MRAVYDSVKYDTLFSDQLGIREYTAGVAPESPLLFKK